MLQAENENNFSSYSTSNCLNALLLVVFTNTIDHMASNCIWYAYGNERLIEQFSVGTSDQSFPIQEFIQFLSLSEMVEVIHKY